MGQYGWRPNAGLMEYTVWHMHDVPLIGTFNWSMCWYVFEGVYDETEWRYYPVSKLEIMHVPWNTSENPTVFNKWYDELVAERPHWVAHTKNDRITGWRENG